MSPESTSKKCHCGNVTDILVGGHCLLCRCDEHSEEVHGKRSTTQPGCGPLCTKGPQKERSYFDG